MNKDLNDLGSDCAAKVQPFVSDKRLFDKIFLWGIALV